MQRINIRREELYELVWSKPRTTIAKELGISVGQDVPVGASPARRVDASDGRGVGRNDGAVGHHVVDCRPRPFQSHLRFPHSIGAASWR